MAYTFKLDIFNHDITIVGGVFKRIDGAAEICQRIKVALWHYYQEYFLNREHGIPYYEKNNNGIGIMGSKLSQQTILNIFRHKIMEVPGVVEVKSINMEHIGRDYFLSCVVNVRSSENDSNIEEMNINSIEVGGQYGG